MFRRARLVRGGVGPADIADATLSDPEVLRLSDGLVMAQDARANVVFPGTRLARVRLLLPDGRTLESDWMQPRRDHDAPPTPDELPASFTGWPTPYWAWHGRAQAKGPSMA
jgi:hypothetical protein